MRRSFYNSSATSAAYIRLWIRSALAQIMACRLFGTEPLSNTMLGHCQKDPQEQTWVKFSFTKINLEMSSARWRPFCPGRDELIDIYQSSYHCPGYVYECCVDICFPYCVVVRVTTTKITLAVVCTMQSIHLSSHDYVIKWKHFTRYRSYVRGNHRSPVNSQHKGQWCGALIVSLICAE